MRRYIKGAYAGVSRSDANAAAQLRQDLAGRLVIENKHSTDVESTNRVRASV